MEDTKRINIVGLCGNIMLLSVSEKTGFGLMFDEGKNFHNDCVKIEGIQQRFLVQTAGG